MDHRPVSPDVDQEASVPIRVSHHATVYAIGPALWLLVGPPGHPIAVPQKRLEVDPRCRPRAYCWPVSYEATSEAGVYSLARRTADSSQSSNICGLTPRTARWRS